MSYDKESGMTQNALFGESRALNADVEWVVCRRCQTPHAAPEIRHQLSQRTAMCDGCEAVLLGGSYDII